MPPRTYLVAMAAAVLLRAQAPAPEAVALELLASEVHGRPVARISASELRVSDAGKAQQILYFRAKEPGDRFPHATVLVINQFDAPDALTPGAWDWLVQAMRAYPQPASLYCYVLTTHGMLFPIRALPDSWIGTGLPDAAWTKESMPLYDTVAGLKQPFRKELETPPGQPVVNASQDLANEGARGLVRKTALQELEARMAPVPGPATLVLWGRPSKGKRYPPDLSSYLTTTFGERIAPLRIYTVGAPKPANASASRLGPDWIELPSSDARDVLKRVWEELEPRYRIAYLPEPGNWDGRLHEVQVKCTRPGIVIESRKQYRAPRPGDLAADQKARQPDLFALAPHDSTVLRLLEANGEVRVNANDLLFLPASGGYTVRLAVQWFRYSNDPPAKISDARVLTLHFTEADRELALREGILVAERVPPSSRIARTRVVVSDMASNGFGTLTMKERR